jgi:hypothetical protein
MRPIKAYKRVAKVLTKYGTLGRLEEKSLQEIQSELKKVERELLKLHSKRMLDEFRYEKEYKDFKADTRTGQETYGYEDEDSIKSNLWYISDRWNCAFRIKWLLDLIYVDINTVEEKGGN